jgi:hypothetical protein
MHTSQNRPESPILTFKVLWRVPKYMPIVPGEVPTRKFSEWAENGLTQISEWAEKQTQNPNRRKLAKKELPHGLVVDLL